MPSDLLLVNYKHLATLFPEAPKDVKMYSQPGLESLVHDDVNSNI